MSKRKHFQKDTTKPIGTTLKLSSGFVVFVKPLPPYYKDIVNDQITIPEYPKRFIELTAGDVIEWEYELPDTAPSIGEPDYDLYMKWKSIDRIRKDRTAERERVRRDFLIANCVDVVSGPVDVNDNEWLDRVAGAFPNYTMPSEPGKRYLTFLKTQVITSLVEMESIMKLSLSSEVTMQGIINALRGFQPDMGRRGLAESSGNVTPVESDAQPELVGSRSGGVVGDTI